MVAFPGGSNREIGGTVPDLLQYLLRRRDLAPAAPQLSPLVNEIQDPGPREVDTGFVGSPATAGQKGTTALATLLGLLGGGLIREPYRGKMRTRFDIGGALGGAGQGLMGGLNLMDAAKQRELKSWEDDQDRRLAEDRHLLDLLQFKASQAPKPPTYKAEDWMPPGMRFSEQTGEFSSAPGWQSEPPWSPRAPIQFPGGVVAGETRPNQFTYDFPSDVPKPHRGQGPLKPERQPDGSVNWYDAHGIFMHRDPVQIPTGLPSPTALWNQRDQLIGAYRANEQEMRQYKLLQSRNEWDKAKVAPVDHRVRLLKEIKDMEIYLSNMGYDVPDFDGENELSGEDTFGAKTGLP